VIIEDYNESGMNVSEYCKSNDLTGKVYSDIIYIYDFESKEVYSLFETEKYKYFLSRF